MRVDLGRAAAGKIIDADLLPSRSFINAAARELNMKEGGAGFIVVDGVTETLRSAEAADRFQVMLTNNLWESDLGGWHRPTEPVRLNFFQAQDGRLPVAVVGRSETFKRMHIDPHSIVFAHRYEVPVNVAGGDIILANVASYMREFRLTARRVFDVLAEKHDKGRLVVREPHRERILGHYSTIVPAPSTRSLLVVVRNSASHGLAHEITATTVINPNSPSSRRFVRTSIAPVH